jgi:hypothetical protein
MKRFFAITILGLASLGIAAQQVSAGWLLHHCCQHCCLKVCAKQYNAFSPYCIDSLNGCCPAQGLAAIAGANCGYGQGPGFAYQDGGACQELPAPGHVDGSAAVAPPAGAVSSGTSFMVPGGTQLLTPGATSQAIPMVSPGMTPGNMIINPALITAPGNVR